MKSISRLTVHDLGQTPTYTADGNEPWSLKLFVAGETAASARAIHNLKRLVDEYLPANTMIQVIDLVREPDAEGGDEVLAVPLLVRRSPPPRRRIIGDLENTERVLRGLDIPLAE